MDGRLGSWTIRYRVISDSASGLAARARLDLLVRERLAEACERSIEGLMGVDTAVYVVRQVRVSLTVNARAVWEETALARKWGKLVGEAAVREVALRENGSANVVRFENQADYLASFIADLLSGQAWSRWFYGAFASFKRAIPGQTVMAALVENREHLPAVLARLRHYDALERMLAVLDASACEWIWSRGVDVCAPGDSGEMRPLFAAALRLAEIFGTRDGTRRELRQAGGLWDKEAPATQNAEVRQEVMQDERAQGSELRGPSERLFEEYLTKGHAPPDWRDRASLSQAVVDALQFLRDRGYLTAGTLAPVLAEDTWRMQVREHFDWLDVSAVENAMALWAPDPAENSLTHTEPGPERPLRPAALTPRRRRLIADLAAVAATGLPALSAAKGDSRASLRLYALLVERNPEWAGDPLAASALKGLLATASWIAAQARPAGESMPAWIAAALAQLAEFGGANAELARQLRSANSAALLNAAVARLAATVAAGSDASEPLRLLLLLKPGSPHQIGEIEGVARRLLDRLARPDKPSLERPAAPAGIWAATALAAIERQDPGNSLPKQFLHSFGDAGLDLAVAAAAAGAMAENRVFANTGSETACAGVFFLIRALVDARLPFIARQAGYPVAPCLLALGLRLGGAQALFHGRIDSGLCALAGYPGEVTLDELRTTWQQVDASSHHRFQAGMLKSLAAHRISGGPAIAMHSLELQGAPRAVVCGGVDANTWPLGRIVEDSADEPGAIAAMIDAWQYATGQQPEIAGAIGISQDALLTSISALDWGRMDLPEVDLTFGLTAISLLRVWAKWLRQFSNSSVPYLLSNFIRRPGRISKDERHLLVELPPRPLDVVLEMAGYVTPFQAQADPWHCVIDFKFRD